MDEELIFRWNQTVEVGDPVYHCGDFGFFRQYSCHHIEGLFNRLNGTVYVTPGSHDNWAKRYKPPLLPPLVTISFGTGKQVVRVVLCHYPMVAWDRSHYGSVHVHGHSHGRQPAEGRRRTDVGVDANAYRPISLGDVLAKTMGRRVGVLPEHVNRLSEIVRLVQSST